MMAEEWGIPQEEEWGIPQGKETLPPPVAKSVMTTPELVASGVSQIPQMLYEGVANTGNAFLQAAGMAQAPFDVAAGLMTGEGLTGAMERGGRRIEAYRNYAPIPPTLTPHGSWMNQIASRGVNALVDSGVISPESAQDIGRLLAVVGGPKLVSSFRAPIAAATENIQTRYNTAFKPPQVLAGELWEQTGKTLPKGTAESQAERAATAARLQEGRGFQQNLGVERLPMEQNAYLGRQQLAAQRTGKSGTAFKAQEMRSEIAKQQAETGFEAAIPRDTIDPARLDFLNRKIEAHNTALNAAEQATTAGAKEAAKAGVESAARAALDEVEAVIPKAGRLDPLPMGQRILQRIRGEGEDTGIRAVQKVFNEEYGKFDKAEAVAPSEALMDAVKESANVSTESGRVLRGFVDDARKVETRLGEEIAGPEGADVFSFPENLTLRQFRGLKGEFATAAELARKANNRPAAMELDRLAKIARDGEDAAVKGLGPEAVTQYDAVRGAYKNVFVEAFRRGYGGKLTGFGTQSGGGKVPPANVMSQLMNRQNAHDFTLALGAEEAAKGGKLLSGVGEADLLALGQKGAREIVQPHVESTLSTLYKNAGGGAKGVAAVEKYMNANANTLNAYGLDLSGLRTAATKYNETMSRLTGAKSSVAKGVVEGVIPAKDATKLGGYVLDSATPEASYRNLLGVSKDPAWKPSVDALLVDELRARMRTGKDVFSDPKSLSLMREMWTPAQMKAAQSYNKFWSRMKEKPAGYGGEQLTPHPLAEALEMGKAYPVGLGWVYGAKNAAKFLAGKKIINDTAAAWSYIDAAILEPAKAEIIEGALRGHRASIAKLRAGVNAEESALKRLAWKGITEPAKIVPSALPGIVGGAAGQKKLLDQDVLATP